MLKEREGKKIFKMACQKPRLWFCNLETHTQKVLPLRCVWEKEADNNPARFSRFTPALSFFSFFVYLFFSWKAEGRVKKWQRREIRNKTRKKEREKKKVYKEENYSSGWFLFLRFPGKNRKYEQRRKKKRKEEKKRKEKEEKEVKEEEKECR